ncbi:FAD-dependent oxidoreductase [Hominenteromicrobium sp.]|uniref:FAD-dependent oxidoreductase n=1 Tax=Hominenteromicrobium sp. TaxID=3073581 RepID=UPI003A91632A
MPFHSAQYRLRRDRGRRRPFGLHGGRRIAKQYRDALATYFPEAFGNAYLVATAPVMGVRESRMIDGVYTLTVTDLKDCVHFEDGIAACNYDIDIHNPEGTGTSHYYFKEGTYYTISYRSLMPKNIKNLLAAGRCISGSHEAQASFRIMPTCCSTGEAAGVAAAVAAQEHTDFPETDVKKIQALLRKHHAFIGE